MFILSFLSTTILNFLLERAIISLLVAVGWLPHPKISVPLMILYPRRRPTRRTYAGGTGKAKGQAKATPSASESSSPSPIAILLRSLRTVADTKARCTAALQAIIDGDCPKPSSSAVDVEAAAAAAVAASSETATSTQPTARGGRKRGGGAVSAATRFTSGSSAATSAAGAPGDDGDTSFISSNPVDDSSVNASLIPLTTHVLQRLLALLRTVDSTRESSSRDDDPAASGKVCIAVAAVALSFSMVEILLTDRPRLEKCAHAAAASSGTSNDGGDPRSVVGRAVVVSSLATLASLEVLVGLGPRVDDIAAISALLRSSTWSALRTLERLAHLSIHPPSVMTPSGSGIQHSQVGYASPSVHYHASSASGNAVRSWKGVMSKLCDGTGFDLVPVSEGKDAHAAVRVNDADGSGESVVDWACEVGSLALSNAFPGEMDLLRAALSHSSTDIVTEPDAKVASTSAASATSKRSTRKVGNKVHSSTPSSRAADSFAVSLLSACNHSNSIAFDGRISVRRWASMSLVWFGLGQKTLLELASQMLRTDCPNFSSCNGVADVGRDDMGEGTHTSGFWSGILSPPTDGSSEYNNRNISLGNLTSSVTSKRKRRTSKGDNDEHKADGEVPPKKVARSAGGGKKRSSHSEKKDRSCGSRSEKRPAETSALERMAASNSHSTEAAVPGNVALVAFAVRLIDLANGIGMSCGVKAPGGGMEKFARAVLEGVDGNGIHGKDSSRNAAKKKRERLRKNSSPTGLETTRHLPGGGPAQDLGWIRPDIRHEASELVWWLMAAHSRCLRENFLESAQAQAAIGGEDGPDGNFVGLLINVDGISAAQEAHDAVLCHPFIPRAVDTLARCAASAITSSGQSTSPRSSSPPRPGSSVVLPDTVSSCIGKVMALASALAFGGGALVSFDLVPPSGDGRNTANQASVARIVDARLASMAVCTLSDCLKRIAEAHVTTAVCTDGENRSSVTGGGCVPEDLVAYYRLGSPLVLATEKEPATRTDGFCSYGSMLVPPPGHGKMNILSGNEDFFPSVGARGGLEVLLSRVPSRSSSISGNTEQKIGTSIQDGDVLALFLRAMLPADTEEKDESGISASLLLTRLLDLVGCCYSPPRCVDNKSELTLGECHGNPRVASKMSFAQSALASDSLNAFREAVLLSSVSDGTCADIIPKEERLRSSLRVRGLLTEHSRRLVQLGYSLDDALVRGRLPIPFSESKEIGKGKEKTSSLSSGRSANDFEPFERHLW